MMSSNRRWWAALVLALCAPGAFAYNPNQPQGFSSERAYHQEAPFPDQVDLFSGRLSVTLPIGPFVLVYNNNVWRYEDVVENNQVKIQAQPDRLQNAGLGWHLGWGELYPPDHWYNNSAVGQWLYVGSDGSRHVFYDSLHRGEDDGDLNVYYTRDGSYLRLRKIVSGSTWDIEFPDGSTHRFVKGGAGTPYRLTKVWDPYGSAGDPDLTVTYSAGDKLRTLTDRHGRNHYVHLAGGSDLVGGYPLSWTDRVITQIDLQGAEGWRSVYQFTYRNTQVNVSCKNTSSQVGPRIRLPHLVRIDLPDGTAYEMEEGTTPSYINTCPSGIEDAPGSLTRMALPAGGVLRWTYQEYEFPPGHNWSAFNTSAGVATREVVNADGSVLGSWWYTTRDFGGTATQDPEVWTDVVALPEGDCSRHFFSAIDYVIPSQGKGWEYGLPFVRSVQNAGRYLSSEVYNTHVASSMLCAGTKVRSTYLRFRKDPTPGAGTQPNDPACQNTSPCSRLDEWFNTNRTLDARRVVFHDDGDRWIEFERTEFDGVGNFRRVVSTGNLWDGSGNNERREVFTQFTHSPGTFPGGGYSHPSPSGSWLLYLFDRVDTTETDAVGETAGRMEIVFDPTTGALECQRVNRVGTLRTLKDVAATYGYDSRGNLTDIKLYGGDREPLPSNTGAPCGVLPLQPEYWTRHEYDYDVPARTHPYNPDGTPGPFLTYDVTVDPLSGAVLASRDPAGFEVAYSYDAAGRLTTVTPQEGAVTTFTYTNPTATATARVHTGLASGATSFREEESVLDDFGRVAQVRRKMPDNTWAERQMHRNARGWLLWTTEWNAPTLKTQYLSHDPFGRPTLMRPPEGSAHDVTQTYKGVREVVRSSWYQTSVNGLQSKGTRTRRLDSYGRLRTVLEPAGPNGSNVTTTYSYDVGGRLTKIRSGRGSTWQDRLYQYDNRGFLLSEQNPEMGAAGNGTTTYDGYDAAGLPLGRVEGASNLSYRYDFLGRLTEVRDRNHSGRKLRFFIYDIGPGWGMGRLFKSVAHNYVTLPWIGSGETHVVISDYFVHDAIGGALGRHDTIFTWNDGSPQDRMRTRFFYDDAGQRTSIWYPRCTTPTCVGSDAANSLVVDYQYNQGRVTGIPGWIDSITYHPSGWWKFIDRANNTWDSLGLDDYRKDRVKSIRAESRSTRDFHSGTLQYDGSGNLAATGDHEFAYDPAGRLKQARMWFDQVTINYQYDLFGNLTSRISPEWGQVNQVYPVNPQTNRLTNAGYDASGNLLNWTGDMQGYTFDYDPFNRLTRQAWMTYLYDAQGERVASLPNVAPGYRTVRYHLRDDSNALLTTILYDGTTYRREQNAIYADGLLLAGTRDGAANHYHRDQLGTLRLTTNPNGYPLSDIVLSPYGKDLADFTINNRLFTGHERDFSTDTDYMHTRHYWSETGRFQSVDSFRGHPEQPQSLNRYAYVMGNPLKYVDPDGRIPGHIAWYIARAAELLVSGDTITVTGSPIFLPPINRPGPNIATPSGPRRVPFGGVDPTGFLDPPEEDEPEPETPDPVEIPPYGGTILERLDPDATPKPPCRYVSAPAPFDPYRYGGSRFLEQTRTAGDTVPLFGPFRRFAFFVNTINRAQAASASQALIVGRRALEGGSRLQAMNADGSGLITPDWCDP